MGEKQIDIPGTERPSNPKIDRQAKKLHAAQAARMEAQKLETKERIKLKDLCLAEGIKGSYVYESDDVDPKTKDPMLMDVVLDDEIKVYVRRHKEPKQGGGEED